VYRLSDAPVSVRTESRGIEKTFNHRVRR
jgi:hypothetical protein